MINKNNKSMIDATTIWYQPKLALRLGNVWKFALYNIKQISTHFSHSAPVDRPPIKDKV